MPREVWVEGIYLHFRDDADNEWRYEGDVIQSGTSLATRQIAVRGDYLEYVDENQDVRRLPREEV